MNNSLYLLPILVSFVSACVPDPVEPVKPTVDQTAAVEPARPVTSAVNLGAGVCGMGQSLAHKTKHDGTRTVIYDGKGAIAFKANYAVNTDGAPNSYHPDDLYGGKGLAINTICNGANAYSAAGEKFGPAQCSQLVDTYKTAKAQNWTQEGGARMRFYGVATHDQAQAVPCLNKTGKYAGFFVSTTSMVADSSFGTCEQERYLDSLETNFIIRPGGKKFRNIGMGLKDLAVVIDPKTGKSVFAVVGDTGPSFGLGEGSVALLQRLGSRTDVPQTRRETYGYGIKNAVTVILPDATFSGKVTQAAIDKAGAMALSSFGGMERVLGCVSDLK